MTLRSDGIRIRQPEPVLDLHRPRHELANGALSAGLMVPLLIMGGLSHGSPRALAIPLPVAATGVLLNVLTASSVRTSAGPNGVVVRFGLLGWPRCTYPLDQIEHAEVIDLQPWHVPSWARLVRTCAMDLVEGLARVMG